VRAALQQTIDSGQTQRQIALRADLDRSRLSRFLAGKHTLTEETLAKLAAALNSAIRVAYTIYRVTLLRGRLETLEGGPIAGGDDRRSAD
jgi:transcriptional regulator with XRE-family HTH domain